MEQPRPQGLGARSPRTASGAEPRTRGVLDGQSDRTDTGLLLWVSSPCPSAGLGVPAPRRSAAPSPRQLQGCFPRHFGRWPRGCPCGMDVPWSSSLCCRCCSSSLRGRAGPCTPPRQGRAPSGTTTSAARWRLAREGLSARPGLGSRHGGMVWGCHGTHVPTQHSQQVQALCGSGHAGAASFGYGQFRVLALQSRDLCRWADSARLCPS